MSRISSLTWLAAVLVAGLAATSSGRNDDVSDSKPSGQSAPTVLGETVFVPPGLLCLRDEQVIFGCVLRGSGKYVSLCGSKKLTHEQGYLQYRFGLPGAIELEFPKHKDHTQQQFKYDHYFRARTDRTEISFKNGGYTYTIFDDYEGELTTSGEVKTDATQPDYYEAGVTIEHSGKEITMRCLGQAKSGNADLDEILINRDRIEGKPD